MESAYRKFWDNLLNFSGTATRSEYWWPVIINYILGGIIIAIIQMIMGHPIEDIYNWSDLSVNTMSKLIALIVWLGTLSLKFRRLHDSDHTAWWILIDLVPIIGTIWFFLLMVLPSRSNRWQ